MSYHYNYQMSISSNLYTNYINQSTLTNNLNNYVLSDVFTPNMSYHYNYQTSISSKIYNEYQIKGNYATQSFVSQTYLPLSGGNLTGPLSIISSDPSVTTISIGYNGQNELISTLPAYDTHRLTFNMRGYDTMYTQTVYNGVITNVLYGTTTINTLGMTGTISFPNNGAGLAWSTNSQIYDDSNLHISSNTNLLLYTPTTCIITTPNTSLSGSLMCTNITCTRIQVNQHKHHQMLLI